VSVITISRGTFSGGKAIAECLARRLDFRCVDREVIVERAAAQGVSQEELRDAIEKPPTLLERFRHRRYMYLVLVQAALAEEVQHGRTIYHGNAGHLLLGGGAPVLRVRIIAPLEFRIRMAQERLGLSRQDVIEYIQKADQDRRRWTQYLYGVDWNDPALYDLVLNLEYVSIDQACATVAGLTRMRCVNLDEECRTKMDEVVLSAQVRRALVLDPATSNLELDVEAKNRTISLRGRVPELDRIRDVERIVRSVAGVAGVNLEGLMSATQG
jgi:cytidylate kinase